MCIRDRKPIVPRKAKAIKDKLIRHCSAFGYIPYINLFNQTFIYVQHAPDPEQTSLLSPAKLASTKNQLRIGGVALIITKIINNERTALKLLVLIFLFS